MWYETAYPFPNFNGCNVEVWEWVNNFIPHIIMDVIKVLIQIVRTWCLRILAYITITMYCAARKQNSELMVANRI